jgi:hypothetical protein
MFRQVSAGTHYHKELYFLYTKSIFFTIDFIEVSSMIQPIVIHAAMPKAAPVVFYTHNFF